MKMDRDHRNILGKKKKPCCSGGREWSYGGGDPWGGGCSEIPLRHPVNSGSELGAGKRGPDKWMY